MTLQWYIGWWNLIYLLPLLLALLYVGVYAVSGLSFGDTDHDFDADADADADVHADADGDIHADTDVDADSDLDSEVEADADAGGDSDQAWSWLGIGQAPLSIVLMVLMLTWGVTGFVANQLLWPARQNVSRMLTISLPLAAIVSLALTRIVSALVARFLPSHETYARRRHELLGCIGQAMFDVTSEEGVVIVHDDRGDLFQIPCRVRAGDPSISKGQQVRLLAYNGKRGMFYVIPISAASKAW